MWPAILLLKKILLAVLWAAVVGLPAEASARGVMRGDEAARHSCDTAIGRVEQHLQSPAGLARAIALTESGRRDPESGQHVPWPWTVNNGGAGNYFDSKDEAIAFVRRLRGEGRTNIDVGCMQVNLGWHADAFESLEEAFDPIANVGYALEFLARLRDEAGSWEKAIQNYHSREPERGVAYRERVFAKWHKPDTEKAEPRSVALARQPTIVAVEAVDDEMLRTLNRMAARATWRWIRPEAEPPVKLTAPLMMAGTPLMPASIVAQPINVANNRPQARLEQSKSPTIIAGPVRSIPGRIPGFFMMPRRQAPAGAS